MKTIDYGWINYYNDFAKNLLNYKNDRKALIELIKNAYTTIGIKLPTLETDNNIIDIDPFTVFGLFNKSSLTDYNRRKILSALSNKIGINIVLPANFDGSPTVNNQNATFYWFIGDRNVDDIDNLWGLFEAALKYTDDKSQNIRDEFCHYFNLVIKAKGINNSKITMGLYWLSARDYLNLDKRSQWFIYDTDKLPKTLVESLPRITDKISAETYLTILETVRSYFESPDSIFKNFVELSHNAWLYSEQVNETNKKLAQETDSKISSASFLRWFAPIIKALRELGGSATPEEVKSKIIENEKVTEEELKQTIGKKNINKFDDEVLWARNYLVSADYIDKSVKGVWTLTESGMTVDMNIELASCIFRNKMKGNKQDSINAVGDNEDNTTHYWLYAPGHNADKWNQFYDDGIMAIGWGDIGNLKSFPDKNAMKEKMKEVYGDEYSYKNDAHATWQFANEIKVGDIIFVKQGYSKIIGRGVVESEYIYDNSSKNEYKHLRKVNWTNKGAWEHPGQAVQKTLTDITDYKDYVEKLKALFEDDNGEQMDE